MINALLKAFTGRAGLLPSLLALAIIALIAFTTVTALPRIEQNIDKQVRRYLEANLLESDSLLGFQIRGRDVLLSGRITDPVMIQAGLMALPGVRGVTLGVINYPAAHQVDSESPSVTNMGASRAGAGDVRSNAATSTDAELSDDASSSTPDAPPQVEMGSTVDSGNPEALIRALNTLFSSSAMFAPGETQISVELRSALLPLVDMMKANPGLVLGVEGYPESGMASDRGEFVGFKRARNTEKFLLERQLEDQRIFTRYLPVDRATVEDGVQLKFYISK